jgi:hypothetical protein
LAAPIFGALGFAAQNAGTASTGDSLTIDALEFNHMRSKTPHFLEKPLFRYFNIDK